VTSSRRPAGESEARVRARNVADLAQHRAERQTQRRSRGLRSWGRRFLVGYFIVCIAVIVAFGAAALSADPNILRGGNRRPPATYYRNCTAAHADGVYSIPRTAPAYRTQLDADGDGKACEFYLGFPDWLTRLRWP